MTTPAAALYVRQSIDHHEGITRQVERCAALVAARNWTLGEVYKDNDTSASKARGEGTAWARMLADRPEVLVAVNLDRLLRTQRDLTTLIDAGIKVVTLEGELDLASASGEMQASVLTAMARFEARRKGERQQRANHARAKAGKPDWRTRPLGFELDGRHRPAEVEAIRAGAAMLLEGASLAAVGREWARRDIRPPRAATWSLPALRKVYLAPRLAGLRTYQGAVIGKAAWDPILDEATFDAVGAVLTDPTRKTNPGDSHIRHLLSGLAECGKCGTTVKSNWQRDRQGNNRRSYRCQPAAHVQRLAEPLDADVLDYVLKVLSLDTARDVLTEGAGPDVAALRAERATVEALRTEWLQSGMSPRDVATALAPLDARLSAIDAALLAATTSDVFGPFLAAATDWHSQRAAGQAIWAELPLHQRRAIVRALADHVVLTPGTRGASITPSSIALRIIGDAGQWFGMPI